MAPGGSDGSHPRRCAWLRLGRVRRREELQRPDSGKKKVCAAAHGDELRDARDAPRQPAFLRKQEAVSRLSIDDRLAVAQQRIGFAGHAVELAVHDPCRLYELKLPRDVRVQADKVQSMFLVVRMIGLK